MSLSKRALHAGLVDQVLALSPEEAERALHFCQSLNAAASDKTGSVVDLSYSDSDARKLCHAAEQMQYFTSAAGETFDLLHRGVIGGLLQDDPGVVSVMELSARALKSVRDDEGQQLEDLANSLRCKLVEIDNANQ